MLFPETFAAFFLTTQANRRVFEKHIDSRWLKFPRDRVIQPLGKYKIKYVESESSEELRPD
jgi:hypothetical protein